MTRRTVVRGSYEVREDIGQRDQGFDFSGMTVGDPVSLDGDEHYIGAYNVGDPATMSYEERDGRTVLAIRDIAANWRYTFHPAGELTPICQWADIIEVRTLLYIESARISIGVYTNQGSVMAHLYSHPTPASRYIQAAHYGLSDWGTVTDKAVKDLSGWVWVVWRNDYPAKTLSVSAWNESDVEPVDWDCQVVDPPSVFVRIFPDGVSAFMAYEMRGITAPGVIDIAQMTWRLE